MGNCLEAAIKYATKYNWAVFPVDAESKRPLTPHGCKDAKKNVGAIKHWWKKWPNANVGIATGSVSGLVVIDEDLDRDKDIDGFQSIRKWEQINGELPETISVVTGRGGVHLYYRYTGSDINNRAGLIEGVDVRGEGGYVVAPPSIHPNGTEYQWEYSPDDIEIADLDDKVKLLLSSGKTDSKEPFKLPATIPSGERNSTLFKLACSLQAQGMTDAAIRATVSATNDTQCDAPLDPEEVDQIINSALTYKKGESKIINSAGEWHEPKIICRTDKDGNETDRPLQTIANAEEAIAYDKDLFGRIWYNEIAYVPYVYGSLPWKDGKGWREWTNTDDSNLRSYIENKYGLKSGDKIMDALTNVAHKCSINPIRQMLEGCQERWDGNKYIENLLPMMLGAEKNEYTTAVMRLFMMGAISRIYYPGCKFDYMLVLVGNQGGGKSSFLRFLALNDDWFNDNFSTLDSLRAIENLRGMWIVELAELQATKRAKDVETIKSFITSRVDTYRAPYNRRTEQRKRMCVLAGTSNPVDFLTDKTGNRRFLPIRCDVSKATFDMFKNEDETRFIFAQAWGEAMNEFERRGRRVHLVLSAKLQAEAEREQAYYLEEDPNIGIIQEWLDTHTENDRVCAIQLWHEALKNDFPPRTRKDINEIHDIMRNNISGWKSIGQQRIGEYGRQRCYERIEKADKFIDSADYEGEIPDFEALR